MRAIYVCLQAFLMMSIASGWAEESLPSGTRWLEHLNNDLLPFWTTESALGKPVGAFPTVRCDDRTLYDPIRPCAEVRRNTNAPLDRNLVALSRQSYGYGVAFHLTGNPSYLRLMKAGIDFIRQNALDRVNGGIAVIQRSNGSWDTAPERRSPQELAYGLLGMAFYYYLTRDADVLHDIVSVKNYIFEKYGASPGPIQWQPTVNGHSPPTNNVLTAQLDQLNTYLVLLTPLLPEPEQTEWKQNLTKLSVTMIERFYSPSDKLFFLKANQPKDKLPAASGTDFGHNAKALWMIRWVGTITGDADLVAFADDNAEALLKRAYREDCGCWAEGLLPGAALDVNTSWWVYAELDQFTGTLALHDRNFARYLPKAYDYWFDYFVDKKSGEVWNAVDGRTHGPIRDAPKQWAWKNGYHSFEHALVGYIVAQQLHDLPVTLYYAFTSDTLPTAVQPYYFSGEIRSTEMQNDHGQRVQKVVFERVRSDDFAAMHFNHVQFHFVDPVPPSDSPGTPSVPNAAATSSPHNSLLPLKRGPGYPQSNHGVALPPTR
jgi:mannose/cellobiose epimerase-like protein (N-acyl-D-glucosamine 2-epimerase family)